MLTTVFSDMKATIEAIEQAGLRDTVQIYIGGGPVDEVAGEARRRRRVLSHRARRGHGHEEVPGGELTMADAATQQLLEVHERRIRDAVALKTPDRVPVVPVGDAFAAHVAGVKVSEFCTDPVVAYKTMVEVFTGLGELDGIQHAGYNVNLLSIIWLSKVKIPGRDLGENDDLAGPGV